MFAAEFALMYWGLAYTTASRSVIFLYSAPFFVALGAHRYIPGERLTRGRVAGLVLAFAGLCLACADALYLPSGRELFGDMLELAAGLLWGATTVWCSRRAAACRSAPPRMLFYQLAISSVALIGASLALREPGVVTPTAAVVAALAYQAVIVAFASYLASFWLLGGPRLRPRSVSLLDAALRRARGLGAAGRSAERQSGRRRGAHRAGDLPGEPLVS